MDDVDDQNTTFPAAVEAFAKEMFEHPLIKYMWMIGVLGISKEFVEMLHLKPGQIVLDAGCGIGGSAFYMAKNFGVSVVCADLSINMINIGKQRAEEFGGSKVKFSVVDITTADYQPASFDVIYCRGTIIHIQDKDSLLANFLKWMKPGGQLLISDYCLGTGELSERFKAYLKQRQYSLIDIASYGKLLEKVGFIDVKAEDRSHQVTDVLKRERDRTEARREEFLKEFSPEDYDAIIKGWNEKLERCADSDRSEVGIDVRQEGCVRSTKVEYSECPNGQNGQNRHT